MPFLKEIWKLKHQEVAERMTLIPIETLENTAYFTAKGYSLKEHLLRKDKSGVIAEFKRASPSRGIFNGFAKPEEIGQGYAKAGVSAISVLTDQKYFSGSEEDLKKIRASVNCPILRKDFIVHEYQIFESKSIGADVILLIADFLSKDEISSFTRLAHNLRMEVILEIHDISELPSNLDEIEVIGVNARNLKELTVVPNHHEYIAKLLPTEKIVIAESGIEDPMYAAKLKSIGYQGFLIGSHFMQSSNPIQQCNKFLREMDKAYKKTDK